MIGMTAFIVFSPPLPSINCQLSTHRVLQAVSKGGEGRGPYPSAPHCSYWLMSMRWPVSVSVSAPDGTALAPSLLC